MDLLKEIHVCPSCVSGITISLVDYIDHSSRYPQLFSRFVLNWTLHFFALEICVGIDLKGETVNEFAMMFVPVSLGDCGERVAILKRC